MCFTQQEEQMIITRMTRELWPDDVIISTDLNLKLHIDLHSTLMKYTNKRDMPPSILIRDLLIQFFDKGD